MTPPALCVLITPSAAGRSWRESLIAHAGRLGWPVRETGDPSHYGFEAGLTLARDFAAMKEFPSANCAVIIDTTATGAEDPGLPASSDMIIARSQALVEAELAANAGALALNAARYVLDLPGLGTVERMEGSPYRIHPSVAESPLAIFDSTEPGACATWGPRWFFYDRMPDGSPERPLIDLTGRMRPVVHGPYIQLPRGRWKVDLRVVVHPERGHVPLLFEWGSGSDYCRVMTEIRHAGTYGASLDRIWSEPDAAQLRIWPAHPVFQGLIGFEGCRVTRMAMDDPAPLTPTDRIVEAAVQ